MSIDKPEDKIKEIQLGIRALEYLIALYTHDLKFLTAYLKTITDSSGGIFKFDPDNVQDDFVVQKILDKVVKLIDVNNETK